MARSTMKPRKKTKGRERSDANGNGGDRLGMHVIEVTKKDSASCASPAEKLDRRDAEGGEDLSDYGAVRRAFVKVGKVLGIKSDLFPKAKPYSIPKNDLRKIRKNIRKNRSDLGAPSTVPNDGDLQQIGRIDIADDTIEPPFDLEVLCSLLENSSALRQNIDAMKTNIDGFGHRFESVLEFNGPDIDKQVRDLMLREALKETDDLINLTQEDIDKATPEDTEVKAKKKLWESIATIERGRVDCFFEFVNPVDPFSELRQETREAVEVLGNAGWEIIRDDIEDPSSRVDQIVFVPFVNVRLLRADKNPTEVEMKIRRDAIHFDTIKVHRFFRRYVRSTGSTRVYYKEFGDPRTVSRMTGMFYEDVEALRDKEGESAQVANEFFHWRIRSQISPYGIPRWIGALLAILGSRAAEEVNFLYFDNKAIPPMVLLVSGGRLSESSVERIQTTIADQIKGRENFHKILVIEGLPADADVSEGNLEHSGKMRLEIKPLLGNMIQDGLFQNYKGDNTTTIGRQFRQPQLLTGETKDMNRSTAMVAKAFAEEQIYQPNRDSFDSVMNRHFLPSLNIHFWKFKTNAPVQRIPNDLVENVVKSLREGAITPNEARKILGDAFSMDFDFISEEWANLPPRVAQALAQQNALDGPESDVSGGQVGDTIDQVQSVEGDLVARGKTDEANGNTHPFVAVRTGGEVRAVVFPGGDDGHTHNFDPVEFADGNSVKIESTKTTDGDHSHEIEFITPISKRRRRTRGYMAFLANLRDDIKEEVDRAKDEFFDPSKVEDA